MKYFRRLLTWRDIYNTEMSKRAYSLSTTRIKRVAPVQGREPHGLEDDYVDDDCPPGAGMHPNG